ncbi:serine-rich adhesin for platelets-like isoform X2 [Venturia canescens]|uniref:serine-rich adhesin for platelets-like isoform X2 n=1 Tax=Venturia canescens TaxID=32260 RepID=UPI001C9C9435|nr:serine-rich adhesin for platelets-like isoform X2 [Venturia canescens]
MASDLSSVCTDDIEIFEEKEEGEISLEDVSSSEESHPHYRLGFRNGGCPNCMSLQHCSPWCNYARILRRRLHRRQDGDHGKENRRKVKESSGMIGKQHVTSTLQEKNDDEDLVPISSDSDMEAVGLPGNSKHVASRTSPKSSKVRKKKKKKRNEHGSITTGRLDGALENVETHEPIDDPPVKVVHASRSHHRDSTSPRYNVGMTSLVEKSLMRSPSRRYRTGRSAKSRSPLRRSRSPVLNHANPMVRRLSRKLRSSRRMLSRSPVRLDLSRESRDSAASPAHVDMYASKLLKKVRHLESVGTFSPKNRRPRSKEHSSLKEKLDNMMKNKETIVRGDKKKLATKESGHIVENNNVDRKAQPDGGKSKEDEDEDIELLRRLALETKQKKVESKHEEATKSGNDPAPRTEANLSDDNDSEALELRMIALHSAVMNKHRNRVERGLGSRKHRAGNNAGNESPFSLSFLDAVPTPDELSDNSAQSPMAKSPVHNEETNNPEDMELDTDVEREKDSMPYSPTDDLTARRINVDDETSHGIISKDTPRNLSTDVGNAEDPRDLVSLGTCGDASRPPLTSSVTSNSFIPESTKTNTPEVTSMSHSPERSGYTSAESLTNYIDNPDAPYSPSKPVEGSKIDYVASPPPKGMTNIETPYSPTDAPIYDPELTHFSPDTNVAAPKSCCESVQVRENSHENATWTGETNLVPMMLNMSMNEAEMPEVENTSKAIAARGEPSSKCPSNLSAHLFPQDEESIKFYEAIIDELPEIDIDGSPLVPVTKGSSNIDIAINSSFASLSNEPLYLQGLPDVTRDDNKIPTLVNKTLVPATILKTNKQLQQPLPPKRLENPVEPSFKSAEMRPVSELEIAGLNATKTFKPIKLCPILKKPQVIMASAAAFNSSFGDDLPTAVESNEEIPDSAIANVIKNPTDKSEIPTKQASGTSSATGNSQNPHKSSKPMDSRRKSTFGEEKSGALNPGKSRSPKTVKAKSVDNYISRSSSEQSKEATDNKASRRRASSSPAADERASKRRGPNNRTASDSRSIGSQNPARTNIVELSSEANSSKTAKKKRTRRGGRNRRARYNVEKQSLLENRRSSERREKLTRSSMGIEEEVNCSSELKGPKDSETNKKAQRNDALDDERPANEELKYPAAKQLEDSKKSSEEAEKSRRLSLDEDEEALRALLLASLPKRAKIVEATPETANPVVKTTRFADTTSADASLERPLEKVHKVVGNSDSLGSAGLPLLSSQSPSSASSVPPGKIDPPIDPSKSVAIKKSLATETSSNLPSSSSLVSSPLTPRKRPSSVVLKNPPKKIAKKALPALASTRVVNNAKKYQNAMLQKRLNLQRAATSYNAPTGSRNITLNNLKTYENARPASPKMANSSSKTQTLVISLESDTDSEADSPNQETNSTLKSGDTLTTKQKPLSIPTTDFEKSLERFLKDQRKKTESNASTASTPSSTVTTNVTKSPAPSNSAVKDLGIYNTPLAVRRHLPVSQQEEYRRLKQQIMERERQMLQKNMDNGMNSQNTNVRSPCTPPGPLSPASPIAATLLAKSHTQKISSHLGSTTVASGREKLLHKPEEGGGLSNLMKVVKAPIETSKKSSLSSGADTARVISRNANASRSSATTSTPKSLNANAPLPSVTKTSTSITAGKTSLQSKQNNASPMEENVGNLGKLKDPSVVPARIKMTSATSLTGSIPASGTGIANNNFVGSLKGTETLTIQIPNDKIQTDRSVMSSDSLKNCTNLAENIDALVGSRNNGALRILSTEQLNNRFIKIQVERGPAGRKVTVGPTTSDSSDSKSLPVSSDMQIESTVICDNRLSFNESNAMRRNDDSLSKRNVEKDQSENSLSKSDASTLGNISTASTLILSNDHLQTHENLQSMRLNDTQSCNTPIGKQTKHQLKEVWEKIRTDVKNELKTLETLSADEQNKFLLETQENLVAKRNMVLEDLTEMSRYLRQWEFEREIQTKLVAEVRRLREQLRAAEDRLTEQRRQMNDMGPRVTRTHEKINHGRRECYKLSRICQGLGNRVVGPNYKIPNTNARLLNEQLKEVAVHTRKLSKKKTSTSNSSLNSSGDVTFSSTMPDVTSIEAENPITSLNETINRSDTPSTPMGETDDEDDANEEHEPTRENEVSIGESNDPVPEFEQESPTDSFSECPHEGELKPRIEETEVTRLGEIDNGGNDEQTSCSTEINHVVNEIVNVPARNAPSEETENSIHSETSVTLDESEVGSLPESNAPTREINALNVRETISRRSVEINKNMLSLDTVADPELGATTSTTINSEINSISLAPKVSACHRTADQLSIPGTSRSVSPTFSLPKDSRNTGKRRHSSYNSVLAHFKTTRIVDPNGILCPYELMGTCNDGDCQYYHLDPARRCQ